ncbi:MAG: hypothetical protein ABSG43_31615 [Solirubrobacteraceae bacterium]
MKIVLADYDSAEESHLVRTTSGLPRIITTFTTPDNQHPLAELGGVQQADVDRDFYVNDDSVATSDGMEDVANHELIAAGL